MEPTERKEYHFYAALLSGLISLLMATSGGLLFAVPSICVHYMFRCEEGNAVHFSLARLAGGLLLSLSLSSISTSSVQHSRVSLGTQALAGLMIVLTGLCNNTYTQDSSCAQVQMVWMLSGGSLVMVLASLGLMASFWPAPRTPQRLVGNATLTAALLSDRDQNVDAEEVEPCRPSTRPLVVDNNDNLMEALLPRDDGEPVAENEQAYGTTRLLKLAAPQVFYLYLGCLVLLIRIPFSLSIPHFVSTTLGALSRGDYQRARQEILLLFILGTIDSALDFWCVFLFGYARERIIRGLRVDTFSSILRQEIGFFDTHTSGELSSRLSSDCGEMAADLTWCMRFSTESIGRITGITIYMLVRCPTLGGCALCIVPVVAIINKVYGDFLRNNAIQVQTALAQANSVAQEAFACVRTVISFATEDVENKKYRNKIDEQYHLKIRELFMSGVYYMVISTFLINTCVQAVLLLIGTTLVERGTLTPEILLAFMLYQGQLQNETMNLFNSYSSLIKSSGAGEKVFQLLDRIPPLPGTGNPRSSVPVGGGGARLQGQVNQISVQLSNVTFSYPTRPSHNVLNGLNLTIPAGSTLALVGPSGSGKSTVIGLLQRFYDPSSGAILIDNVDLRETDLQQHRRHRLGVVTQDPILFSGSIRSNLTYGCPWANNTNAIAAAKMAHAHDFITTFPDGYDTNVGERGVAVSGGQKQRIAIARAICKNPSLLLLDEATSALDSASEQAVQAALDQLLSSNKGMTTVVVAHRLRTVRDADSIAYMENGQVLEQGTHEQLMELPDGLYKKMVERTGSSGTLPED